MAAGKAPLAVTGRDEENLTAAGETHPGHLCHRSARGNRRLVPHEGDYSAVVDDLIGKHDGPRCETRQPAARGGLTRSCGEPAVDRCRREKV